jgi:NCS1 family nucleobase:cation symporter-1
VPALYDPHGRYRYYHGTNIQGLIAFLIAVCPNLPGLANSVSGVAIPLACKHLYSFEWLYGFVSSVLVYTLLNRLFPSKGALVPRSVYGLEVMEAKEKVSVDRDVETESESRRAVFEVQGMKEVGTVKAVDLGKIL